MQDKHFVYVYNGISYPVTLTRKRIRSYIYHFRDNAFYISTPNFPWIVVESTAMKGLEKYAPKLIQRSQKKKTQIAAIGDNYIYLLGNKVELSDSGTISIQNMEIKYSNKDELLTKIKKWFLSYIIERNLYYEDMMNAPHYRVKIRDMKSRFGSNSRKSKTIAYSTLLLHYKEEIIDSVIVHEIAHDFVFNHSNKFYEYVYKYCPNYKIYRKKLLKGEFQ